MRVSIFAIVSSLVLAALCATLSAQPPASAGAYQVVVHPNNSATAVDRQFVQDAFLKKITAWPGHVVIRPVDLAASSPVRRKFTEDVLNRSVEAVKGYWQQRIFSGRDVPPPELDTDDDVIAYVLKYEGAIGYVSGSANLRGTKTLVLR
jgi:ABC-type phosphate transport system substrate-binding protein